MADDFPPLPSLEAFVHSAETLSFKDAADRLHVSPSALSRRIQSLEERLGVSLFRRINPGLELTPEGTRYLEAVRRVFGELRRAEHALRPAVHTPLRVSALQSFTESWLIPHLPDFEQRHPGIGLEITATLAYADFDRDPVDVAIRFGTGPWEGLHSEPLLDLVLVPVCSPVLLHGERALRGPQDLARHTLIAVSQVPQSWPNWLKHVGLTGLEPARTVTYDHMSIVLSAAETGQGVALCPAFLCKKRLAEGKLCVPFDLPLTAATTYHLVCRPQGLEDPRIVALRDWLVDSLA